MGNALQTDGRGASYQGRAVKVSDAGEAPCCCRPPNPGECDDQFGCPDQDPCGFSPNDPDSACPQSPCCCGIEYVVIIRAEEHQRQFWSRDIPFRCDDCLDRTVDRTWMVLLRIRGHVVIDGHLSFHSVIDDKCDPATGNDPPPEVESIVDREYLEGETEFRCGSFPLLTEGAASQSPAWVQGNDDTYVCGAFDMCSGSHVEDLPATRNTWTWSCSRGCSGTSAEYTFTSVFLEPEECQTFLDHDFVITSTTIVVQECCLDDEDRFPGIGGQGDDTVGADAFLPIGG